MNTERYCRLEWCASRESSFHRFCKYHWGKLVKAQRANIVGLRPLKTNDFILDPRYLKAIDEAMGFLTQEHSTLVDCPKCKGRGINQGHTSYLRGKTCSWCNKGKRPKIS